MALLDDILDLDPCEEWGDTVDGNEVIFFKYELCAAEKVAFPGMTWRGGYVNGNSYCILEFETEPSIGEVEALYSS